MKKSSIVLLVCGMLWIAYSIMEIMEINIVSEIVYSVGWLNMYRFDYGSLVFILYISTLVSTVICAKDKGIAILGWIIAALLVPFFPPFILTTFILAFYPSQKERKSGVILTKWVFGNTLEIKDNMLKIKQVLGREFVFDLRKLRFIYAIIPEYPSQYLSTIDLDELSDNDYLKLSIKLKDKMQEPVLRTSTEILADTLLKPGLDKFIICIADYNSNYGEIDLRDIKAYNSNYGEIDLRDIEACDFDFFQLVRDYRISRYAARQEWLTTNPKIIMKGTLWQKAVLDKEGFQSVDENGQYSISWNNVEQVNMQIKSNDIMRINSCYMYLIDKSGHKFGTRIRQTRKDIYLAECNFWRTVSTKQA